MRLPFVLVAGLLILGESSAPAEAQQHRSAGPSFDCSTARPGAEQAICVYPDLAKLDRIMANLYRQLRATRSGAVRKTLIASQRQWLKRRNACGSAHACLSRVHHERIRQLQPRRETGPEAAQSSPAATGRAARQFVVIVPELNVFPKPRVRSHRIGALHQGDGVVVERWQYDRKGEKWARVRAKRISGWVAAEFLQIAPSGADDAPGQIQPDAGASPTDSGRKTGSSRTLLDELPDIEGLEKLR